MSTDRPDEKQPGAEREPRYDLSAEAANLRTPMLDECLMPADARLPGRP